jgi:hypothetical protein
MQDKVASPRVVVQNNDADFVLTNRERRLISNFRATEIAGQEMLLDTSEQYMRILPAAPVKLSLLRAAE